VETCCLRISAVEISAASTSPKRALLQAFCLQRLGYSENEAQKRIQVARLYQRLPQVLAELENGSVHLTGLFLLHTSRPTTPAPCWQSREVALAAQSKP
jgi:hypothetical protein